MNKIGIFFGTETGTTRLVAKKLHKLLGDEIADKPVKTEITQPSAKPSGKPRARLRNLAAVMNI